MTAARIRRARCGCGVLTASARGEPADVYLCACQKCQIKSGSAFSYAALFAESDVTISGEHTAFRHVGDSGRWIENRFCPTCGTTVFFTSEGLPGMIGIAAGCFADADVAPDAALMPQRIYWAERKRDWVRGRGRDHEGGAAVIIRTLPADPVTRLVARMTNGTGHDRTLACADRPCRRVLNGLHDRVDRRYQQGQYRDDVFDRHAGGRGLGLSMKRFDSRRS